MRALVWFRSDLRVEDNRALYDACREADRGMVGVFTVCPRQWQAHDWADAKVEFILRNVACLAERLRKLNIPLRIVQTATFAEVPDALLTLAQQTACDALYFGKDYEVNERARDRAVLGVFGQAGLAVRTCDSQAILPPGAVRTKDGRFYSVFTPFRKSWLAYAKELGVGAVLPAPRRQAEMPCSPDLVPEAVAGFDLSLGQPERWAAGENVAKARLGQFMARGLGAYKQRRDLPAEDGTSGLSPYLTAGVLSPRVALREAAEANRERLSGGRAGPDTWISELIWREFYRHVLVGYPRVSRGQAFRVETDEIAWREDEEAFEAWCVGRTGFPIVDAGMRQLAQTGWLHNRVRMIVAMFLTKDLFIDWRWGERHFMRHLVDGDLASNNGGWQWSASTGTDAAPYFRIFNPLSQGARYDPEGEYIRRWVPELRDVDPAALHDDRRLAEIVQAGKIDYPPPVCDHAAARDRVLDAFKRVKA